jgi:hypothetical protein
MATIVPDDFARVLGNTCRIDVLRLVELCLALEADPAVVIDELCRTVWPRPGRACQRSGRPWNRLRGRQQQNRSGVDEMHNQLIHGSWALVHKGCPMDFSVSDDRTVTFMFGRSSNYFEFSLDTESLQEFVKLGRVALQEMYALPVEGVEPSSGERSAEQMSAMATPALTAQ